MDIAALIFAAIAGIIFIARWDTALAFTLLTASWISQFINLTGTHIRVH